MTETTPVTKTITFISRATPYGQGQAKACLDMVLSAAVFDQKINFIFMDDGIWQLKRGQTPSAIDAKDLSAAFAALPLYEVNELYVDASSMQERGLDAASLVVPVTVLESAKIAELISQSDVVFTL